MVFARSDICSWRHGDESVGSGNSGWDYDRAYAVVVLAEWKIVVVGCVFIVVSDAVLHVSLCVRSLSAMKLMVLA